MTSQSRATNGSTSTSLLHRVGQQDAVAWKRFAELYGPLVFHWCKRSELSDEDAADVMQEVFASVSRGIERFLADTRENRSFRGWLRTITTNRVRDHYRKHANRITARGGTDAQMHLAAMPDDEDPAPASEAEVDSQAEASLFQRAVDLVRDDFAEHTWQAFWRSTILEQETQDVAADLGMSTNSVRQAKSRVLRRLRQELGDFRFDQ